MNYKSELSSSKFKVWTLLTLLPCDFAISTSGRWGHLSWKIDGDELGQGPLWLKDEDHDDWWFYSRSLCVWSNQFVVYNSIGFTQGHYEIFWIKPKLCLQRWKGDLHRVKSNSISANWVKTLIWLWERNDKLI